MANRGAFGAVLLGARQTLQASSLARPRPSPGRAIEPSVSSSARRRAPRSKGALTLPGRAGL